MRSGRITLRAAALLAGAALALHELRYLVAGGGGPEAELAAQGHAYLPLATTFVLVVLPVAAVQLIGAIARAFRTGDGEPQPPDLFLLWLLSSSALLGVHVAQEAAESLLTAGRPDVVAALAGPGGPVTMLLACGFGLLVALALRGAGAAVAAAVRRFARRRPAPALPPARPYSAETAARAGVLARHLAGRAPPLAA
jgi:hypothetical protein